MKKAGLIGLALVAGAATLGGCAGDYYGGGVATGYYDGPVGYGYDYYGGLGYPGYGYFNNYYYPGYGTFVFDRGGHRRAWNDAERAHWAYRGNGWRGNHLYGDRGFEARRDHAYMADRQTSFRNYRSGFDGPRAGGSQRPNGQRPGGGDRRRP